GTIAALPWTFFDFLDVVWRGRYHALPADAHVSRRLAKPFANCTERASEASARPGGAAVRGKVRSRLWGLSPLATAAERDGRGLVSTRSARIVADRAADDGHGQIAGLEHRFGLELRAPDDR